MANPVKAASVGIGWWSNVLADAVQKTDTLEIVTCFTRNPEKRAGFAEKYGCRESESYEAVLKDPEVEAILLTTPHAAHRDQIEGAARSGKHVFVEKPLAHIRSPIQRPRLSPVRGQGWFSPWGTAVVAKKGFESSRN